MLILKGDNGKSRVIDFIRNQASNLCFEYSDYPVMDGAIYVNTRKYNLLDFLECISDTIKDALLNDKHYDYLLIYTNWDEESLEKIISWISQYGYRLPCRDIILTCK